MPALSHHLKIINYLHLSVTGKTGFGFYRGIIYQNDVISRQPEHGFKYCFGHPSCCLPPFESYSLFRLAYDGLQSISATGEGSGSIRQEVTSPIDDLLYLKVTDEISSPPLTIWYLLNFVFWLEFPFGEKCLKNLAFWFIKKIWNQWDPKRACPCIKLSLSHRECFSNVWFDPRACLEKKTRKGWQIFFDSPTHQVSCMPRECNHQADCNPFGSVRRYRYWKVLCWSVMGFLIYIHRSWCLPRLLCTVFFNGTSRWNCPASPLTRLHALFSNRHIVNEIGHFLCNFSFKFRFNPGMSTPDVALIVQGCIWNLRLMNCSYATELW